MKEFVAENNQISTQAADVVVGYFRSHSNLRAGLIRMLF
jgi:hypothetical protein